MDALPLLRWTMSPGEPAPEAPPAGEEPLYHFLSEHRLLLRFLDRVRRERPRWCSDAFVARLERDRQTAETKTARELAFMRTLAAALPAHGGPLVLVKGISVFALLGDPRRISPGADLDLFFGDLDALWAVLTGMGFRGERPEWRAVWHCADPADYGHTGATTARPHEFASFEGGEIQIDAHAYYPVLSYPPGVAAAALDPGQHPGRWEQRFGPVPAREIRHEHLREHCMPGSHPATRDLRVPDPNMAALILCAHEFRTAIHPPVHADLVVQMGKLADLHDLVEHPRFDRGAFGRLVEQFAAHDAVRLVGWLLKRHFGRNPFHDAGPPPPPRLVTWFGGWASLTTADELLVPPPLAAMIRRLQPNTVEAPAGAPARPRTPERVIAQSAGGASFPFAVAFFHDAAGLHCDVHLPEPLPEEGFHYHLHLYGDPYDDVYQGANLGPRMDKVDAFGNGGAARLPAGEGYAVRLTLPWSFLPPGAAAGEPLPLVLLLSRWDVRHPPPYIDADPVLVAPIELTCAPAAPPPGPR